METGGGDGEQEQTKSISYSSSSGTIVSTRTTYTSRGSLLSSFSNSIEAAMHLDLEAEGEEEGTEKGVPIRILLQELFLGAPPLKGGGGGGGGGLDLERWFTQLGVAWVLHLNLADGGGAPAGILEHTTTTKTRSWIRALTEITEIIRFTASLFPDHPSQGLSSIFEEEEEEEPEANEHCFPDHFNNIGRSIQQEPEAESEYYSPDQFNDIETFIQESMSKMLSFVDIIAECAQWESFVDNGIGVPPLYNRTNILLSVHNALSKALSKVRLVFHSAPSQQVERMTGDIVSLLSAKNHKAGDAIWSTMEQIRLESIEEGDNSSTSSQDPQAGSSDIHKATRSVMRYVMFVRSHYSSLVPIVSQASRLGKYVPQSRQVPPLISLVIEMVSSIQEKLAKESESFEDQALKFLFLLNNANMICKYIIDYPFPSHQVQVTVLAGKVESYMQSYLQLSWAPPLSCLLNPTPIFFGRKRHNSSLSKFKSEFKKVYTIQKLWKVPDPELRKMLRKAIAVKIIPVYTKYIKDHKLTVITTLKFRPQMLEDMLQEIFEG